MIIILRLILKKMNDLRNMINNLKEIIYKRILSFQNLEIFMMNNLQKDLQKNIEKYNGKHHNYKKVKLINYHYCYPILPEASVLNNFIRFWNWISIFHLVKTCTSLTLFYFNKVIKARAKRNRNAIISNISELCQTIIFDPIPIEIDEVGNNIE